MHTRSNSHILSFKFFFVYIRLSCEKKWTIFLSDCLKKEKEEKEKNEKNEIAYWKDICSIFNNVAERRLSVQTHTHTQIHTCRVFKLGISR